MNRRVVVNALTFSRVPLIFAWLVLAIIQMGVGGFAFGIAACVTLTLSALTDLWDGRLARKWGVVSTLGKMADPLMDKVFYVVTFPTLAWIIASQGESGVHALVMLGFAILYLLRDLWVTFMRSIGTMYGADVAAMRLGKVRTALSFPCAGWVYAYVAFHDEVMMAMKNWNSQCGAAELNCREICGWWLGSCYLFEATMVVLTLVSFVTYTRAYLPYMKKALAQK